MVFFAWLSFNAAADINSIYSELDCLGSVIRIYPAGQKNTLADMPYDIPVETYTCPAVLLRVEGIQQNRISKKIVCSF